MCRHLTRSLILVTVLGFLTCSPLQTLTVEVKDSDGKPVRGFRWQLEEDTTQYVEPGVQSNDVLSLGIHKTYAPVVAKGQARASRARVRVDRTKRHFVSVLPNDGYTMSGAPVAPGQRKVTVIVNRLPIPTAQVSVYVFHDYKPLNNAPDVPAEEGLEGFTVLLHDAAGQLMTDAFGNMLGTTYQLNADGSPLLDGESLPIVDTPGTGIIRTDANGEALIKNLPPE